MKALFLAATLLLGAAAITGARTQTAWDQMNHNVQKLWDDTFYPDAYRDSRTDWERRRDAYRREWCRENTGYARCPSYR